MILKNQILLRAKKKSIVWDAFFDDNNKSKPLVIFCHGYKGFKDWGPWNLVAEHFSNNNFFFVKFNFSHNGGTVDNPIDFPDLEAFAENNYIRELEDLDALLNFLHSEHFEHQNEIDFNNVILIGHSRGGGISIIKASEDQRITKLITWASVSDFGSRFGSLDAIAHWKKEGVKYVLNGRTKQQMPHNIQFYEAYKAYEERLNIEAAAKRLEIPTLIIHGDNDTSVSINEAKALHQWNPNSELKIITGADHVFNTKHPWDTYNLSPELEKAGNLIIDFVSK